MSWKNLWRKHKPLAVFIISASTLALGYIVWFVALDVYFPGDILPEMPLNTIRQSSHPKLKRRLSNTEYNTFKALMVEVVKIFTDLNIR